jgi:hypothetical protein
MNPALMEKIAQTKGAEMRRTAATRIDPAWEHASGTPAKTWGPAITTGILPAARRTTGWFLVRVGLRLAMPRPRAASAR